MANFIDFTTDNGDQVPVNPDLVAHLANSRASTEAKPMTRLIFGAVAGGVFELHVRGAMADVRAQLVGDNPDLAAYMASQALAGVGV